MNKSLSTSSGKQGTNPKLYLTAEKLIDSNQEYFYTNNDLEYKRKQDERINYLANNFEKLSNEITEIINHHQQLKDAVCSEHVLQNNINQNIKKQINHNHKEIFIKLDEHTEFYQNLFKQISHHETVHELFITQINEQKDSNHRLSEQVRLSETGLTKQLANNNQTINNKINRMIREQRIFRDKQNDYIQDIFKQISQHEIVHDLISTQLNDQKDSSERLSEQIRQTELGLIHQLKNVEEINSKISGMIDEQWEFREKQNVFIQDLFKHISQHETVHDLFTTQLNEQIASNQRLSEQVRQTETDLTNQLKNNEKLNNKIKRMIREHQMLKVIVDSYLLLQNNINQDLKKQINKDESKREVNQDSLSIQLNEQKDNNQNTIEQLHENEIVHLLSKRLNPNYESIQDVKNHLGKNPSLFSEQLPTNSEMIQYPFALILNILPSNYPTESIYVNGKQERVTAFLSVNNQEKMAFFLDEEIIKKFDFGSIEGITLKEEW